MKMDHSNLLIYLKGINNAELQHLTDFLYNGEAFIVQEELNSFLETARELQIKGINFDSIIRERDNECKDNENLMKNEIINDATEELAHTFDIQDGTLVEVGENNHPVNINHELNHQTKEMIEKNEEGLWECKVCGKTSPYKWNTRKHTETHLEGISLICYICNKIFSTRDTLRAHMSNYHSKLFSCNICEKSGMNRNAYRMHKQRRHKVLSEESGLLEVL